GTVSHHGATSAMVIGRLTATSRGSSMYEADTAGAVAQAPTPAPRPRILVADTLAPEGLAILEARAEVVVRKGLGEAQLIDMLRESAFQAIVVRSETRIPEAVLAAAPSLQVVGRAGVGVDTIDVEAATRHGVLVLNMPTGNTITTAEHTMALLFAVARNLPQ